MLLLVCLLTMSRAVDNVTIYGDNVIKQHLDFHRKAKHQINTLHDSIQLSPSWCPASTLFASVTLLLFLHLYHHRNNKPRQMTNIKNNLKQLSQTTVRSSRLFYTVSRLHPHARGFRTPPLVSLGRVRTRASCLSRRASLKRCTRRDMATCVVTDIKCIRRPFNIIIIATKGATLLSSDDTRCQLAHQLVSALFKASKAFYH